MKRFQAKQYTFWQGFIDLFTFGVPPVRNLPSAYENGICFGLFVGIVVICVGLAVLACLLWDPFAS